MGEQSNGLSPEEKAELDHFMKRSISSEWLKPRLGKFSLVASAMSGQLREEVAQRSSCQCEY